MSGETVTILKSEYKELLEGSLWGEALEAAGVDNWQGYDDALEFFEQMKEENNV